LRPGRTGSCTSPTGSDQILARLPDGRFEVVAGSGKVGFGGDGGPARRAELASPGGMAVAADGAIYFADEQNNRVRMISPDGIIATVAGSGIAGPGGVPNGTPALRARLSEPADVVIGPDGELYIACYGNDQVLRLAPNGRLYIVAGPAVSAFEGITGVGGPAAEATPGGPTGLAFDGHGDLYIASGNVKGLLMIDRAGIMRQLIPPHEGFYPRGDGGLVTGPHGAVYAMDGQLLVRLTPAGMKVILSFAGSHVLGGQGTFLPDGIAVGANGVIYTDTFAGNGWASTSAIASLSPGHRAAILWSASRG
jgi:DNA-binding beta-propeller fold protein YncE